MTEEQRKKSIGCKQSRDGQRQMGKNEAEGGREGEMGESGKI